MNSSARADESTAPQEPRIWRILAQTDASGFFLGLPQRLSQAAANDGAAVAANSDAQHGGDVRVIIEYEGIANGRAVIGFFTDPRWRSTEPVTVRMCSGPGVHVLANVAPGEYCLGAMVGTAEDFAGAGYSLPPGCGLGVHDSWPDAVAVRAGETTDVRLRISDRYQTDLDSPDVARGMLGFGSRTTTSAAVRIQSLNSAGRPLPFCRVTLLKLTDNDPGLVDALHEVGTDIAGNGRCDSITGNFRATLQTEDLLPDLLAHRLLGRSFPDVHDASLPAPVELSADDFPNGTATVEGRVRNQFGQPLREFYMTLSRQQEFGKFDSQYFSIKMPFIDDNGRYKIPNLPPGGYAVMIRHFDYATHVYRNAGHAVVVPEEANARVIADFQVEAKELFYGRAVFDDAAPVPRGGWTAHFTRDPRNPFGGEYFSLGLEDDGRFRVCLSQAERRQVADNFAGMVDVFATSEDNRRTTLKIPIETLSRDVASPTPVVFARTPR